MSDRPTDLTDLAWRQKKLSSPGECRTRRARVTTQPYLEEEEGQADWLLAWYCGGQASEWVSKQATIWVELFLSLDCLVASGYVTTEEMKKCCLLLLSCRRTFRIAHGQKKTSSSSSTKSFLRNKIERVNCIFGRARKTSSRYRGRSRSVGLQWRRKYQFFHPATFPPLRKKEGGFFIFLFFDHDVHFTHKYTFRKKFCNWTYV